MELAIPGMTNYAMLAAQSGTIDPSDEDLIDATDVQAGVTTPVIHCSFADADFTDQELVVIRDIEAIGSAVSNRFKQGEMDRMKYDEFADAMRLAIRIIRLYLNGTLSCGNALFALNRCKNQLGCELLALDMEPSEQSDCLLSIITSIRDLFMEALEPAPR